MKISRYGVGIRRITIDDIELIRNWRNSPAVRDRMIYREYITPEMQMEWFRKIDNYRNFYYIIEVGNEKVGLINNKDTDWEQHTTESGLFLFDEKFNDTYVPVAASMILLEAGFLILGGRDATIRILSDNHKAIAYNKQLGFEEEACDEKDFKFFRLTREQFLLKTHRIREMLTKSYANRDPRMYMTLEAHDYENGVGQEVEKVIAGLPKGIIISQEKKDGNLITCLDF
jgi:UDP-4-amino-4,6-dideoxy-N-acetyl-beta-L-altrosamine N-acetyltransferase